MILCEILYFLSLGRFTSSHGWLALVSKSKSHFWFVPQATGRTPWADQTKSAARAGHIRNAPVSRCRCFLPDLTGFTKTSRAVPNPGDTGRPQREKLAENSYTRPRIAGLVTISSQRQQAFGGSIKTGLFRASCPPPYRPPFCGVRIGSPADSSNPDEASHPLSVNPHTDVRLLTQAIHSLRGFAPSIQMSNSALLPNCVSIIKLARFMMRQRLRHGCRRPYQSNSGGERGIRTLGTLTSTHAFQACSFNHSDISPDDHHLAQKTAKHTNMDH